MSFMCSEILALCVFLLKLVFCPVDGWIDGWHIFTLQATMSIRQVCQVTFAMCDFCYVTSVALVGCLKESVADNRLRGWVKTKE